MKKLKERNMVATILGGNINANGTIHTASDDTQKSTNGYSVAQAKDSKQKTLTGVYDITFNASFTACPVVLCKQNNENWNDFSNDSNNVRNNALLIAAGTTGCRIKTGDSDGNAKNKNFTFIAIDVTQASLPSNMVAGQVSATGEILSGSGFDCLRIGEGRYILSFHNIGQTEIPVVVANPIIGSDASTLRNAIIVAAKKSFVEIEIGDNHGDATDCNFVFLAYDPGISTPVDSTISALAGTVSSSCDLHSGSNFTVSDEETDSGLYCIEPATPPTDKAIVVVCENYKQWTDPAETDQKSTSNANPMPHALIPLPDPHFDSKLYIRTGDSKGNGADRNFAFFSVNLP